VITEPKNSPSGFSNLVTAALGKEKGKKKHKKTEVDENGEQ
jgi:hypothetical protein